MSDLVNLSEACSLLGKTPPTFKSWVRQGCPVVTKGSQKKEWEIRIADVVAWREEVAVKKAVGDTSAASIDELKERKLAAETSLAEIEAAKARDEVVYIDDVLDIYTTAVLSAKAKIRNVPGRVVPQIIGETDEARIKEVIEIELDYALEELVNSKFVEVEEDTTEED